MPPPRVLPAGSSDVARFLDTAHKARYVEIFENQVLKTAKSSEYIIKKGILKRKVSGGSMSEEGVMAYAVLQSISQTCHLRGLSFVGYLTACLLHYIRTGTLLLLSQYEIQINNKQAQKEAA